MKKNRGYENFNEKNVQVMLDDKNLGVEHMVAVDFDFPTSSTAVEGVSPVTGDVVYLPQCLITDAFYKVYTTFTAEADAAVLKLGTSLDDDEFVAAVAISDASNTWDAGIHGTIISGLALGSDASTLDCGTAATYNAERFSLTGVVTNAGAPASITLESDIACTAGKLRLWVKYVEY